MAFPWWERRFLLLDRFADGRGFQAKEVVQRLFNKVIELVINGIGDCSSQL